jgi:hypothetical protein
MESSGTSSVAIRAHSSSQQHKSLSVLVFLCSLTTANELLTRCIATYDLMFAYLQSLFGIYLVLLFSLQAGCNITSFSLPALLFDRANRTTFNGIAAGTCTFETELHRNGCKYTYILRYIEIFS